jgi:hypothetical protein
MTDTDLIREAVEASRLSARRFAEHIMSRDERTVRRWLSGEVEIPAIARMWLTHWLSLSDGTRERIVGALVRQ